MKLQRSGARLIAVIGLKVLRLKMATVTKIFSVGCALFVRRGLDIQRNVGLVSVSLGFPWMTRGEPVDNVVERREVPEPGPRIYLRGQIVEYLGDLLAGPEI